METSKTITMTREVTSGTSNNGSTSSLMQMFGLGEDIEPGVPPEIVSIRVEWPSGRVYVATAFDLNNIEVNTAISISEKRVTAGSGAMAFSIYDQ